MSMKKTWFYKLLFSYLPVFLIVILFLIAVSFFSMGELTRRAALTVNEGSAAYALEIVDHELQSIENMMIKEMMETGGIQNYYNRMLKDDPYKMMLIPSKKLGDIAIRYPSIHSIYMVRWEDDLVLSNNATIPLTEFGDKPFIQSFLETGHGSTWTGNRMYIELANQYPIGVVSLVKKAPLPSGDLGIVVINVRIKALQDIARDMLGTDFIQTKVLDSEGNLLLAVHEGSENMEGITKVRSDYTGWIVQSNIGGKGFYRFASGLNYILLWSGIVAIMVAVVYIAYISKRHSRPLEALINRLRVYAELKAEQLLKGGGKDEFTFIESVLDGIIEQADELLNQRDEHLRIRKRQWIMETLEGDFRSSDGTDWLHNSKRFGWKPDSGIAVAVVIEIDRYTEFCSRYTKRDQSLLKFLLANVAAEIAQQQDIDIFGEWLEVNRWCAFLQMDERKTVEDAAICAQQIMEWIQSNVDFAITIGLGASAETPDQISTSYDSALHALQYKMTLGINRVIAQWEIPDSHPSVNRVAVADIRSIVHAYKLGESNWEAAYDQFTDELRSYVAPRTELQHQMDYLIYQISGEVMEMHADYQSIWFNEALPQIKRLENFETLEELSNGVKIVMCEASTKMAGLRESRNLSGVMKDVRNYIAANFENPDLSLNHLSDAFSLSPKYVSHMFKEEFGEKFVDYLAGVRIDKARGMLENSSLSIQEIAVKVGYNHSFSFIRVFKKLTGMTPGDFKKQLK